jgi:hypothetical protein
MKHLFLFFLIILFSLNPLQAQHKAGSRLLILNVGFTAASPEDNDNDLHGNTFSLNYESSNLDGNLAGGVSIAYMVTSADSTTASGGTANRLNSVSYNTLPVIFYGRYMFGPDQLRGYIGAGFGIQFSNARFYTDNVQTNGTDSGVLIGGMAGLNYFFNDKIFINGNYNLSWLSNSFYRDGMVHNFTVGLGFQFF